jgi:hypothetical protein
MKRLKEHRPTGNTLTDDLSKSVDDALQDHAQNIEVPK